MGRGHCPYVNLCKQWEEEIINWGVNPVGCHGNSSNWSAQLESDLVRLRDKVVDVVVSCVTNDSFRSESFQSIILRFKSLRYAVK